MPLISHASPLAQEILAFETERQEALVSGDPVLLDRLLHADLVHIHSSGQVHGKAEFISHVERMGGFLSIVRGPLEFRSAGEAVIITGTTINRVRRHETQEIAELNGFGSVVVVRGALGWQVLLSQITILK